MYMAESEGFEPSVHITANYGLANRYLRPLGQLSISGADSRDRTGDLILTKDVRYRLCHVSEILGATCRNRTNFLGFSVRRNDHTCSSGMVPPDRIELP